MIKNKGSALLTTLIVLVVLMIVSLTFMRVATTSNQMAGGVAFKEAASQAGDVGINLAQTALNAQTNYEADIAGQYFATVQPTDSNGIPTTIDWSQPPITTVGNYNVQFIIDRLCTGPLPVQNFTTACLLSKAPVQSNKVNDPVFTPNNAVFYRVTVRITGPSNVLSYIQAILIR